MLNKHKLGLGIIFFLLLVFNILSVFILFAGNIGIDTFIILVCFITTYTVFNLFHNKLHIKIWKINI